MSELHPVYEADRVARFKARKHTGGFIPKDPVTGKWGEPRYFLEGEEVSFVVYHADITARYYSEPAA